MSNPMISLSPDLQEENNVFSYHYGTEHTIRRLYCRYMDCDQGNNGGDGEEGETTSDPTPPFESYTAGGHDNSRPQFDDIYASDEFVGYPMSASGDNVDGSGLTAQTHIYNAESDHSASAARHLLFLIPVSILALTSIFLFFRVVIRLAGEEGSRNRFRLEQERRSIDDALKEKERQGQRREHLIKEFKIQNVSMVVKESDIERNIIEQEDEDTDIEQEKKKVEEKKDDDEVENNEADVESQNQVYESPSNSKEEEGEEAIKTTIKRGDTSLTLPCLSMEDDEERCSDGRRRHVPGMCAICLEQYESGDTVVWSKSCTHAFHETCVVNSLCLVEDGHKLPCPTCRQEFIVVTKPPVPAAPAVSETDTKITETERSADIESQD